MFLKFSKVYVRKANFSFNLSSQAVGFLTSSFSEDLKLLGAANLVCSEFVSVIFQTKTHLTSLATVPYAMFLWSTP